MKVKEWIKILKRIDDNGHGDLDLSIRYNDEGLHLKTRIWKFKIHENYVDMVMECVGALNDKEGNESHNRRGKKTKNINDNVVVG